MFEGAIEAERPEDDAKVVRTILPEKPPRLVRVMLELAEEPALIVRLLEFDETPKWTTVTMTCTVRVRAPLNAVIATV